MSGIRLSVCIPTYNFGRFIGETLESIVRQATEEVEIVVLDGGSTDNTTEVVEGFRDAFPRLRYYRQDFKGGIDRDMAKSVELARGEYCWLFSCGRRHGGRCSGQDPPEDTKPYGPVLYAASQGARSI